MSEETAEKRGPGAPLGNHNAMKSSPIDMTKYDLRKVEDCFSLLQVIFEATLAGKISARTCGALNNNIRIILSYHSDIQKAAENQAAIEESKRRIRELEEKLGENGGR